MQSNWTPCSDNLTSGLVLEVQTAALTPPNGAPDNFVDCMQSTTTATGGRGWFYNGSGFAPAPKGGAISMTIQKVPSAGPAGWCPLMAMCWQGAGTLADTAYLLGFGDADPAHIILCKGPISAGLPDIVPTNPVTQGVLRRSTDVFGVGTWLHLMLQVAWNANLDAVITVFRNDLTANSVMAPVWLPIAGIENPTLATTFDTPGLALIDDGAGIITGTPSLEGGRFGFATWFRDTQRRAAFDEIEIHDQT